MRSGIIDFHMHPYLHNKNNYCNYKESYPIESNEFLEYAKSLGISYGCGSVVGTVKSWEDIVYLNDQALALREQWGGFYIPGFHIHPGYINQSINEIKRMAEHGVKIVGELLPYMHGWNMHDPGMTPILEQIENYDMVLSYHSTDTSQAVIADLLNKFPKLRFIAAHPGEKKDLDIHLELMRKFDNYYLDLSGTGMGRHGMLRYSIDNASQDRFLFGTDSPICPPEMYISVIESDPLLTEAEKSAIFHDNAYRTLFGE